MRSFTPLALLLSSLFLTLLEAPPASAITLTRGPYLQLLTTRSVTIVWNTDVAAACALAIRPLEGRPRVIPGATGTVCAIAVDGLRPGAHYAYTPLAGDIVVGTESVFRTDDPDVPFTFLVVGDTGSGGPTQLAVRDRMLATPADFLLHTGDMIYQDGAAADFDPKFFVPYQDIVRRLMFWPCVGNHDVHTENGAPWRDAFYTPANNPSGNEHYYSFDFGNAHLVVLDSNASTCPDSPQQTFLEQDLAAATDRWTFVAFHHTIYSSGSHGSDTGIRDDLVPVFDRHGVDVVFMGHDHHYERTHPLRADQIVEPATGTVYVTTGGGGKSIRPVGQSSFTAYVESAFHLTRVSVDGGTLLLEMIRDDGAVRDSMRLAKEGPPPPPACDPPCEAGVGCTDSPPAPIPERCQGRPVPRRIHRMIVQAKILADRAGRARNPGKAERIGRKAGQKLDRVAHRIAYAVDVGRVSRQCGAELTATVNAWRTRATCVVASQGT